MTNLIVRLFSVLGSSASLLSLIFVFHPLGQAFSVLEGVLIGFGIVLTAVAVFMDIRDFVSHRPKSYRTQGEANSETTCITGSTMVARSAFSRTTCHGLMAIQK